MHRVENEIGFISDRAQTKDHGVILFLIRWIPACAGKTKVN